MGVLSVLIDTPASSKPSPIGPNLITAAQHPKWLIRSIYLCSTLVLKPLLPSTPVAKREELPNIGPCEVQVMYLLLILRFLGTLSNGC